ncbi:helix-turn-helix transcriptional regulator [Larkinella soli]|uniref:helix-turn-helix transcriptional regulator n=1 Tax=Larkinella soli TaxID=1770527 RepID=UPI0013E40E1F|nr:LuxR C-terminal-related transcriptional regulator [Larkinella soli]
MQSRIVFSRLDAVSMLERRRADWVLADSTFAESDLFELIDDLRLIQPDLRLLVLVDNTAMEKESADRLIHSLKPDVICGFHDLPLCLQSISLRKRLLPSLPKHALPDPFPGWKELSEREKEVLRKLAEGKSTSETAMELNISPKTVENHKTSISAKLYVNGGPGSLLRFIMKNSVTILSTKE